jgi:hypothetical protein
MKKSMILFLLLLPLLPAEPQLPDADQILSKSRDLTISQSMSATVSLLITDKNGSTRKRTISLLSKSYSDGAEKRLIKFTEPADVRGTTMLIIDNEKADDEMWIYMPALKRTRRIVSSDKGKSYMSSEFTNADMSSPSPADFRNSHLPNSGTNKLWIIESIPINEEKEDEYGFSRKVSYISEDNWQLKKMEFYNFDSQLFKIIEVRSVQPGKDGKYIIKDMVATNLLNGRSSEIAMDNVNLDVPVADSYFSVQNLER